MNIVIFFYTVMALIVLILIFKTFLHYKNRLKRKFIKIYSGILSVCSGILSVCSSIIQIVISSIPSDKYIITILVCSTLLLCSNIISNQNRYQMSPLRIFDTRTGDIYIEKTINVNKDYDEHGYKLPTKLERVWQKYDFSDKIYEKPKEE